MHICVLATALTNATAITTTAMGYEQDHNFVFQLLWAQALDQPEIADPARTSAVEVSAAMTARPFSKVYQEMLQTRAYWQPEALQQTLRIYRQLDELWSSVCADQQPTEEYTSYKEAEPGKERATIRRPSEVRALTQSRVTSPSTGQETQPGCSQSGGQRSTQWRTSPPSQPARAAERQPGQQTRGVTGTTGGAHQQCQRDSESPGRAQSRGAAETEGAAQSLEMRGRATETERATQPLEDTTDTA